MRCLLCAVKGSSTRKTLSRQGRGTQPSKLKDIQECKHVTFLSQFSCNCDAQLVLLTTVALIMGYNSMEMKVNMLVFALAHPPCSLLWPPLL